MSPTVLCIDDHPGTLQTLSLLLQFAGYNCLSAAAADEALAVFAEKTVDVVIVDQRLPGVPGDKLARQLKAIRDVRVMMLTGDTLLEEIPPCVDLLQHKPCPPQEFLDAVASLVSRKMAAAS